MSRREKRGCKIYLSIFVPFVREEMSSVRIVSSRDVRSLSLSFSLPSVVQSISVSPLHCPFLFMFILLNRSNLSDLCEAMQSSCTTKESLSAGGFKCSLYVSKLEGLLKSAPRVEDPS